MKMKYSHGEGEIMVSYIVEMTDHRISKVEKRKAGKNTFTDFIFYSLHKCNPLLSIKVLPKFEKISVSKFCVFQ